ncbi:MAG TPA: response regulator [Methylomirabilota bacterium]|nr:response regulator [Methylomirabilota bacterium]
MQDTVLVAAGGSATALAMEFLLSDEGFTVYRAEDRDGVHGELDAGACRVMILDAAFPDGGGFPLLEALRCDPATKRLPVVMLIARCGYVETEKARALGADAVVEKPFAGPDLVDIVRRLARRPQARTPRVLELADDGRHAMMHHG